MNAEAKSGAAQIIPDDRVQSLAAPVEFEGRGLFSGEPVKLTIRPARPGVGIVFTRSDIPGRPSVRATADNAVAGELRYTMLRSGEASVSMVEHLLAAANALNLCNLEALVDGEELPCLDGSARPYVDAFIEAGLVKPDSPGKSVALTGTIAVESNGASISAEPHDEGLEISYTLDYGDKFLRRQSLRIRLTPDAFAREIAPARTYVLRPEIDYFRARGLGGGATPENIVVVEENGGSPTELRFADECVRHKILDMLGDLALIGLPLKARVTAEKSGHALNARLAGLIRNAAFEGGEDRCDDANASDNGTPRARN